MPRLLFSSSLLLVASLAAACSSDAPDAPTDCFDQKPGCVLPSSAQRVDSPDVPSADQDALVEGGNDFALDLARELHSANENVVFSPYSISTALAMTYAGAEADTATAMAKALHFTLAPDKLHPAFDWLAETLASRAASAPNVTGGGFRFNAANAIWQQLGLDVEQPFLDTLAADYGAHVRLADFDDVPGSVSLIDAWVSTQTNGKIPKLLTTLPDDVLMVLVNAVYFNAAWATPFDASATASAPFATPSGSVMATMMHGVAEAGYVAGDGFEAVDLPYAGTEMSMLVVMPDAGTIDDFESTFDAAALDAITKSAFTYGVATAMPKLSFGTSTSLKKALGDLGMGVAFGDGADFDGIVKGGGLKIDDVVHQATITIDEQGTEAAASTAVLGGDDSGYLPASITVDHPFFFFIRDDKTGAVIFAGRVNDPTKT